MPDTLATLLDQLVDEDLADSPVSATNLGLEGFGDRLDDLSAEAFARRRRRTEEWLTQLEPFERDGQSLSFDQRIDLDVVLSNLRGRAIMADWEMWRRQPDTYLNPGLSGVFGLFLHRLWPEDQLARIATTWLRAVPRNLEDGMRNLRPDMTPAIYVERALGQARAASRYARELLPPEVRDERLRGEVADAGSAAAEAYDRYVQFLQDLLPNATGEWAIGEQRYTRLLREKELLPYDARALRERGQQEYDRLAEELRRCAQVVAQTDDWVAVLQQLNEDHPPTPEAMRQAYAEWTLRARKYLAENSLVSFPPGEECAVEPSPPFQRPVLGVASYQMPPAFSSSMRGHFFVPYPPDGASDEEIQKRLAGNSYPSIPTTSVHEAYPGHHWHLVMAKSNPSRVRKIYRTPYFTEGWALYTERMMREQGFFTDPRHEMSQYEATIFRAARIVVDTSLHMGEMSYDDAVRFMMERANLTEPVARAEVTRYCAWPTQASAYLTGCLEILDIRERFFQKRGRRDVDSLREFHDRLGSSGGGLPIALIEQVALAD